MNTSTRDALINFIQEVENMSAKLVTSTGIDTVIAVVEVGDELKRRLLSDETILETR